MRRAVCPGSFDPITFGHLDIIERASHQFDEVIVTVFVNRKKAALFTIEERMQMIQQNVAKFKNVRVDSGDGLLVEYCKANKVLSSQQAKKLMQPCWPPIPSSKPFATWRSATTTSTSPRAQRRVSSAPTRPMY